MKLFWAGYLFMTGAGVVAWCIAIANGGHIDTHFSLALSIISLIGVTMMLTWGVRMHNKRREDHYKALDFIATNKSRSHPNEGDEQ